MKLKNIQIIGVVLFAVLANVFGKFIAVELTLPLWLDSFGTAFAAYMFGPFSGACVGACGNLIYELFASGSQVYAIVSILIGVIVGIMARRGGFESFFRVMSVCTLVTFVTVAASVPINMILYDGMTGNLFGDGVIDYLIEHRFIKVIACVIGEAYIDFPDKVLTLAFLYMCIKIKKHRMKLKKKEPVALLLALALMASLALPLSVHAKEQDDSDDLDFYSYVQTIYNSENGLPCGKSNDIVETSDGVLWIGTYAGLYRYNGREFRLMTEYDSVKNVNCLYRDNEGRLWIGTNDNGFSIAIHEEIANVVDMDNGLPSNSVRSIVQGADGYYYIGTADALQVVSLNSGLQMCEQLSGILYAHSIAADETGYIAAVTSTGQLFILKDRKIVLQKELSENGTIYTCCEFDNDGKLIVGNSSGQVIKYELSEAGLKETERVTCNGVNLINNVIVTEDDLIYVCAENGVYCIREGNKPEMLHLNGFDNSIDNMIVDYQGNLWFTSSRLGLLRLSKSAFEDMNSSAGITKNLANTVIRWQGKLYVGMDKGLCVIDEEESREVSNELTERFDGVRIRCLMTDSKDNLWISTYGEGLFKADTKGKLVTFNREDTGFSDWVRCTIELRDGTVVAAGDLGVAYFQNDKMVNMITYGEEFLSAMVLCLYETEPGVVLAGSDGDGVGVIENGVPSKTIGAAEGLDSGVVLRITPTYDKSGYYIVASNGLFYMDKEYNTRSLDKFPYFNNFDVYTTQEGDTFVLSSAGVYVTKEEELLSEVGNSLRTELLDSTRGLTSGITANSWNYMDENEMLYIATDSGVYSLNTNNYSSMQKSYRMSLKRVRIDQEYQRVERGNTILLGRDATKLEMFPEIINYTVENPMVRYQLVGYDQSPMYLRADDLDTVTYTKLPSGTYTFEIAVLNSDGQVLEESTYAIEKEMEVYDHWSFYLYMFLIAGGFVAWLTWFIARTQVQRTLKLQARELALARQQVQMGNETILAIAKTVDAKDENTSQHSRRVSEYAALLAREMGFTEDECENLRKAALLHDIGKISIPDRILNKPAKLTDEEYTIMKSHVLRGAEILKDFTLIDHVVEGALYHHERYDGKGYANGLAGEEIPIYGRIIGVADAFDAMTQNRVYRKKLDMDFVTSELKRCSGTQFDPQIAEIMLRLVDEGKVDPILKPQWEGKQEEEKQQVEETASEGGAEHEEN